MNTNTNRNYDWNNTINYWTNPTSAWIATPFSAVSNNTPYSPSSLLTNPFTTRTWLNSFANSTPAVNAYESTESYVLELAAPGYEKESFEVSYSASALTVKATARTERNETTNYSTREFSYSSFTKEFSLPANAEASELRAKYENGVLTVLVPKTTNSTNYKTVRVS